MQEALVEKESTTERGLDFTVDRTTFLNALARVAPACEKGTTIPILKCVLIETIGNRAALRATDLELWAFGNCPITSSAHDGAFAIPARRFRDYLRLVPEGELRFSRKGSAVEISWGDSLTRIEGMSRESFPELQTAQEPFARIPAATIKEAINSTIFAIREEESRFTLDGALLILKDTGLIMVATDGCRLALFEKRLSLPGADARLLLPSKALKALAGWCEVETGEVALSASDNYVFADFGQYTLVMRKLTGNFPGYERVLPKGDRESFIVPASRLIGPIERVMQFADQRAPMVRLQIAPDLLTIRAQLSETGSSTEKLALKYGGLDVEIPLNGTYLLDGLRAAGERDIEFLFTTPDKPIEMRWDDAETTWRYIVMPMRG